MRRTHLRKHSNILKRLLIHAAGMNLGLLLRNLYGLGTPRGLQGLSFALHFLVGVLAYVTNSENIAIEMMRSNPQPRCTALLPSSSLHDFTVAELQNAD
jgi:hypothetical protein